jgi:DNA-binding response OmpR family regulator
VAVLICLGERTRRTLVDAVRSGRDDVPVILYGSLGGAVRDLADVLELGADHFLAAPVGDEELASVLAELAGPGRTLEILAARLHSDAPAEPERDGIDLAALGLDAVPDVDAAGGGR